VGGKWIDRAERVLVGSFGSLLRRSRPPRLKRCADRTCRRAFVDETRSRTRRWCDLGTCGNRVRVRRHRARLT
jgi:predicted RNA-binding Zn ribbon-like protein